jgi:hypothetical protein
MLKKVKKYLSPFLKLKSFLLYAWYQAIVECHNNCQTEHEVNLALTKHFFLSIITINGGWHSVFRLAGTAAD